MVPLRPSDAPELADAIRTADPETLRARFLGAPPPLTAEVLDRLTRVDQVHHVALVARDADGCGVAVARYIAERDGPDTDSAAEVAVAVAPAWRRVGLASALLTLLAQRALECGITRFTATYLAQNRPVAELAHNGHAHVMIAEGVGQLRARLDAHRDAPR